MESKLVNEYGATVNPLVDTIEDKLRPLIDQIILIGENNDLNTVDMRILEQMVILSVTNRFAENRLKKAMDQRKKERKQIYENT